jgi:hypothetical protein
MSDELFQASTTTLWTDVLAADGHSAAWVAAKTFQHTWEHGNSILCIALFENADEATVEQLFAGARACPTQAIIIEQFGRRVYPTILTPMFGASREEQEPVDG